MGLLDTITNTAQDVVDQQPKTLTGTVTSYYNGQCTVNIDDEESMENLQCVNIPKIGTQCLLVPVEDTYQVIPNEIDDTATIYALGLGKFTINDDGYLIYELPIGVSNYMSINNNGELIVNLDNATNQEFSINDEGECIYGAI